ncbi:hypothetical protein JG688_00010729, partial [Phytophthora aleatoria]
EKVAAYISDVLILGRILRKNGELVDDQDLADVLLNNAVEVYPELISNNMQSLIAVATSNEVETNEEVKVVADALSTTSLSIVEVVAPRVTVSVDVDVLARGLGAPHFVRDCPVAADQSGSGARRSIETLNVMLTPRNSSAAESVGALLNKSLGLVTKFVLANKLRVLEAKAFEVTVKLVALVTKFFLLQVMLLVLATKWVVLTTALFVLMNKSIMLMSRDEHGVRDVHLTVRNAHNGQYEERLLESVYYTGNASGRRCADQPTGNPFCHEKFTAGQDHVVRVLTCNLSLINDEPAIPIVQIKSGIETNLEDDEIAQPVLAGVPLEGQRDDLADFTLEMEKQCAGSAVDIERSAAVQTQCAETAAKSTTAKKGKNCRKRKRSTKEGDDSADDQPFILRKPTVALYSVVDSS